MKGIFVCCGFVALCVTLVRCQSDFLCPPNTQMGLCEAVPNPCYSDSDCYGDSICCPHACARTCKPRNAAAMSPPSSSMPDLLNDPRVYVGQCPNADCYNLFGGDPNQCDTSNLCPPEQFCCNDGCKNVCQWKPEYAAMLAEHEARVRQQQQIMFQKQQQEAIRRQQEAYVQQQRNLASAERARQQAQARAAAEAELAAERARAKYAADMKAAAEAQAKAAAAAAAQAKAVQQQPQQPQQQSGTNTAPSPSPSGGSFLDNFVGTPQVVDSSSSSSSANIDSSISTGKGTSGINTNTQGFFAASKQVSGAGGLANQINSPASSNPYSLMSQQNSYSKVDFPGLASIMNEAPPTQSLPAQGPVQSPPTNTGSSYLNNPGPSAYPRQVGYQPAQAPPANYGSNYLNNAPPSSFFQSPSSGQGYRNNWRRPPTPTTTLNPFMLYQLIQMA